VGNCSPMKKVTSLNTGIFDSTAARTWTLICLLVRRLFLPLVLRIW
jgi:hypothetical protein